MPLTEQIIASVQSWQEQLRAQLNSAGRSPVSMATLEQAALALGQRLAQLALADQLQQAGTGYSASSAILALRSFVLNERLDELCPKPALSGNGQKRLEAVTFASRTRSAVDCFSGAPLFERLNSLFA